MKSLVFIFLSIVLLSGCKKKENEDLKTNVTYFVAVNVEDEVNYSMKFDGGPDNFVNVIPPAKNASQITNVLLNYGETKTVLAELGFSGRGKMIEIVVTNSETKEVVFSDKKVDKVIATWTAKK